MAKNMKKKFKNSNVGGKIPPKKFFRGFMKIKGLQYNHTQNMRIKIAINFQIWHMSATTLNTARPEWFPGQVTVDSRSDFRVVMEGKATNGGFAIDQLIFSRGKCESK